jgi:hypothetical protein
MRTTLLSTFGGGLKLLRPTFKRCDTLQAPGQPEGHGNTAGRVKYYEAWLGASCPFDAFGRGRSATRMTTQLQFHQQPGDSSAKGLSQNTY